MDMKEDGDRCVKEAVKMCKSKSKVKIKVLKRVKMVKCEKVEYLKV